MVLDGASELSLLSFAARLLLSQLDRKLLLERGLESFLDFAQGRAGAVFLLDGSGESLKPAAVLGAAAVDAEAASTTVEDRPWSDVLAGRMPRVLPLCVRGGVPAPSLSATAETAGRECLCVPLLGDSNRPLGVVTLDRDANDTLEETRLQSLIVLQSILALGLEQASARERLLEAHEELEGLYAAKTKMIDHLSHELKTPLAVLSASTGLLGRPDVRRDDERAASVLGRMDRAIARLLELQEEASDIAEVSVASAQTVEITLDHWVPEVLDEIAPLHSHRGVRVATALTAKRSITVSEPLLRKALIGLVRNAIEATADGGWVRVATAARDGGDVVLEVSDTGVGMDETTRKQVFHGFVHAGRTDDYRSRRAYDFGAGGRGLDLLRTHHFADRQGFTIEVESEPGKGSTFRLVFPAPSSAPISS